ncbi:hypothetical protein LTR56_000024 [Elasticomyces elasticus]|nr:hypothetical protein LTR22_016375 [Elasticomyces elasticus]KAK3661538.1 hypothetical protein LTR56_000024 [Elasticomyces elasticus]KAK4932789.1 hypothetical protein LTR49_000743 [Elasticomyces elasticus]KAK5758234.1 hypothetical protein LTS12_011704 [Elasticomyces elasticus]
MAFSGSHTHQYSAITSGTPKDIYSTAYNGSQGRIEERDFTPVDLENDGYDLQLPAPTKAAPFVRPAFGARLLSTISNAQPSAAALTRKGSVLHSRAKSLAGFAPKPSTSNTSTSPERGQQRHPVFGDWFNGESAPVRLGLPQSPTKEKEETEFVMEYKPAFTERPVSGPRRRSTAQTAASTPASTKAGWFGRKSVAPAVAPPPQRPQDDILATDINSSLFPNGPADPMSPHAFNDLLLNATNLLQRMQAAYKEKVDYITSVQPEIEAQKEEVEEAETRAAHLKLQLEDMSSKAQEQNDVMQEMAMQLAEEKMKVQEARESAKHSVRMVRRSMDGGSDDDTPRRRKRGSAGSASDSGFESDMESILSGGVETPLSPPSMVLTPAYDGRDWAIGTSRRPVLSRQSTASGSSVTAWSGGQRPGGESAAWATAENLRGENVQLRRQVEEMQRNLQGCIEFVGSVKA